MSEHKAHPLRGASAALGGSIAGLALHDPAAGFLAGLGLGLMLAGVLRAYGRY